MKKDPSAPTSYSTVLSGFSSGLPSLPDASKKLTPPIGDAIIPKFALAEPEIYESSVVYTLVSFAIFEAAALNLRKVFPLSIAIAPNDKDG
ncbi:hypothetical protein D3C87_1391580 [compost metagenome]